MRRPPKRNRLRLGLREDCLPAGFFDRWRARVSTASFSRRLVDAPGQRQHLKEWIVLPKRGALYDRGNEPLALSLESQSVYVRPHRLQNPGEASLALAHILNMKPAKSSKKLAAKSRLSGSSARFRLSRRSRFKRCASTASACTLSQPATIHRAAWPDTCWDLSIAIPRVSRALELQYNDYIRGAAGSSVSERDALGRRVLVEGVEGLQVPPGSDVHLTLDIVDSASGGKRTGSDDSTSTAPRPGSRSSSIPFTGEVLALANYPTFNPNKASQQSVRPAAQSRGDRQLRAGLNV